jgi:hypothetical protein
MTMVLMIKFVLERGPWFLTHTFINPREIPPKATLYALTCLPLCGFEDFIFYTYLCKIWVNT